jgi:hypothetical protein
VHNPSLLRVIADGRELARVAQGPGTAGHSKSVFLIPDDVTSITDVQLEWTTLGTVQTVPGPPVVRRQQVNDISVSDIRPSIGTPRQLNQVIAVEGSAPADGTLVIEHETDPLGEVLVYVSSVGYIPALRVRRVSGEEPTDAPEITVSGAYNTLATNEVYEIPVGEVPEGTCALMALMRYTGDTPEAVEISWDARVRVDGADVSVPNTGTTTVDFTALPYTPEGFGIVLLDDLQVPDWQLGDGSVGVVRLYISSGNSPEVEIDEAWLFNTDIGYLTHVRCGAAEGDPNRLWLLPATIETNIPKLLIGTAADQSNAYHPSPAQIGSWMPPYFEPDTAFLHLVTTNAEAVSAALEHQPRWHTRARRVIGQ